MPKLDDLLYDIRRIAEHRAILSDKKIASIYRTLEKDLTHFLADVYAEYADADGRLYVSSLDAQRKKAWFLNEIVKNVDGLTEPLQKELMALVDTVYETCYKGMATSLKSAQKDGKYAEVVKDLAVNKSVLKRALDNNVSRLTLPRVLEKNRAEVIYQIQQELNIGLLNGDRYEQMAKRISDRVGVSRSKADNIVRTETHRNTEGGLMDSAEHIQERLDGSGLIYAATWRTMQDERVRPQQRRKTKKGWKTYRSKSGANHMKLEGKTVAVGELFDLGNGVKTKAPGESGDAANDCSCRCFLEYNLMTAEEFVKNGGKLPQKAFTNAENGDIIITIDHATYKESTEICPSKIMVGHAGTPKKAEPNSVIDHAKNGKVDIRTFYDGTGLKQKDVHTTNHGNPKTHPYGKNGEHIHEYEWDSNGDLKNKTMRELTQTERKENGDIL